MYCAAEDRGPPEVSGVLLWRIRLVRDGDVSKRGGSVKGWSFGILDGMCRGMGW